MSIKLHFPQQKWHSIKENNTFVVSIGDAHLNINPMQKE